MDAKHPNFMTAAKVIECKRLLIDLEEGLERDEPMLVASKARVIQQKLAEVQEDMVKAEHHLCSGCRKRDDAMAAAERVLGGGMEL